MDSSGQRIVDETQRQLRQYFDGERRRFDLPLNPSGSDFQMRVWRALLESNAGEQAARMTAMDNASNNCKEMITHLTLVMNKARQAAITKELMDIVGGAEALKG